MVSNPSTDPHAAPRATAGRAPDVFRVGGWVPMAQFGDAEEVDFVVVGTGAGGGPVIAGLAEAGFSVVGFDAGPYFRPLEDFASDETEQNKLYWTDERVVDGANPMVMGGKNSGKAVGGSTVHFAMVSLRFRPEWFKSRSKLGYGVDWPLDWREMWGLLRSRRTSAQHFRPDQLPVGTAAPPLSLSRARAERGGRDPGPRCRGDGLPVDAHAACHRLGAAWQLAALRLSRLLPFRLLHERQAEPAGDVHPARAQRGCRNPRPRHGRPDRGEGRSRDRRALHPRRANAGSSAPAT